MTGFEGVSTTQDSSSLYLDLDLFCSSLCSLPQTLPSVLLDFVELHFPLSSAICLISLHLLSSSNSLNLLIVLFFHVQYRFVLEVDLRNN
ncbi:hypothetical protein K1719_028985 [Acacia pycnantha]|nr:hypothetical protein K1719_028985 [Acacia pycnantha]